MQVPLLSRRPWNYLAIPWRRTFSNIHSSEEWISCPNHCSPTSRALRSVCEDWFMKCNEIGNEIFADEIGARACFGQINGMSNERIRWERIDLLEESDKANVWTGGIACLESHKTKIKSWPSTCFFIVPLVKLLRKASTGNGWLLLSTETVSPRSKRLFAGCLWLILPQSFSLFSFSAISLHC